MLWKREKEADSWNQRRFVLSMENKSFEYYIKTTVSLFAIYIFHYLSHKPFLFFHSGYGTESEMALAQNQRNFCR